MSYSYRDYYRNKRPSSMAAPANPAFVAPGQPIDQGGLYPGGAGGPSLMFGGKPAPTNFQNSFGQQGYGNDGIDFGSGGGGSDFVRPQAPQSQPMPQPTFGPRRNNVYTGMPSFKGGGFGGMGGSDPFSFLLSAMGGGTGGGMLPLGAMRLPGGGGQQYGNMTPEQKLQMAQAGPSPGPDYELIPVPVTGFRPPGPGGTNWQWRKKTQFAAR